MFPLDVNNLSIKNGMELTIKGVIKPNPIRFCVNVGHSKDTIALHVNPRFAYGSDVRTIVLNSRQNGSWQKEERDKNFPFEEGKEFEMSIVLNTDTFDIYMPNCQMLQFPNRLLDKKYNYISFAGEARLEELSVRQSLRPLKK